MEKVDYSGGKRFLTIVFAIYGMVFFFSYFYFLTAGTTISGKVVADSGKNLQNDLPLVRTILLIVILSCLIAFIYIIPKAIHKKMVNLELEEHTKTQKVSFVSHNLQLS